MITPALDAILQALFTLHLVTIPQVQAYLQYKEGCYTTTAARLKHLTDAGYVHRLARPRVSAFGRLPQVYMLARRGINYLHEVHGLHDARRFHPSEHRLHSYLFVEHTLAVNDFLIAAHLAAKADPHLSISRLIHERSMKPYTMQVNEPQATPASPKRLAVVFDGFIQFEYRADKRHLLPVALELDRGTENQVAFRRKVRGIVAALDECYPATFGVNALTVAVLTTASAQRASQLLAWIEAELQVMERVEEAELFRVRSCPSGTLDPAVLLREPSWIVPISQARVPLIELPADVMDGSEYGYHSP